MKIRYRGDKDDGNKKRVKRLLRLYEKNENLPINKREELREKQVSWYNRHPFTYLIDRLHKKECFVLTEEYIGLDETGRWHQYKLNRKYVNKSGRRLVEGKYIEGEESSTTIVCVPSKGHTITDLIKAYS